MKKVMKLASVLWISSPFMFILGRMMGVINIEHQNATMLVFLCFISYFVIYINEQDEE